ncbi:hypothetical protein B296_00021885 [Ensete ventricosum]|uniref:Uncharacterized protein n=1 Tax=Ensete ventricosum TaxID=4639 RepID=A0A426ZR20_ENSVE|nr:hypothetical protein B296_00021885 [Ensete ventricosum]
MGNYGRCYGKMGRQQDEALSTVVEEDVGEEITVAIGATTRWVRLEAAGRDEVTIGDDNAVATEVVAALKMSWLEIWRHYWPSIGRGHWQRGDLSGRKRRSSDYNRGCFVSVALRKKTLATPKGHERLRVAATTAVAAIVLGE